MSEYKRPCKYNCGATITMREDVAGKWGAFDQVGDHFEPHWKTCTSWSQELARREAEKAEKAEQERISIEEQKRMEAAYRAGRRQDARQRQENMRALVKGTPMEQTEVRQVEAPDGFEDDWPEVAK